MLDSERTEFGLLLHQTAELYGKTLSSAVMNFYWEDLQGYSLQEIRKALKQHRVHEKHGRFMPKSVDLIEILGRPKTQLSSAKHCAANWQDRYKCTLKPTTYNNWCDYHWPLRDKVHLPDYEVLKDEIFFQTMTPAMKEVERVYQEYRKKYPLLKKPSPEALEAMRKITAESRERSSTPHKQVLNTKEILDKMQHPYSQLLGD